jgi:hypothetical protein
VPLCWQAWVYGVAWYGVILLAGVWLAMAGHRGLGVGVFVGLMGLKLVDMKLIRDRM